MKIQPIQPFIPTTLVLVALATMSYQPSTLAQGSLTPPGAPAPTMKTLAQIEPRTPISSLPYNISVPGSYYVTTNLTGTAGNYGVTITSGNVVLDLEGFTLSGVPTTSAGVYVNGACVNVTVRNGSLRSWAGDGVYSGGQGVILEHLNASANSGHGLYAYGGSSVVRDCSAVSNSNSGIYISGGVASGCAVSGNANYGIEVIYSAVGNCEARNNNTAGIYASFSTVDNCLMQNNTGYGINSSDSTVRGCSISYNSSHGVNASTSSVRDCQVEGNSLSGVRAMYGSTVSGCLLANNVQSGVYVYYQDCQIIGNTFYNNNTSANTAHAGIYIYDNNNRVENNHVTGSGYAGIAVNSGYSGNVIVKNTVSGNGANNYLTPGSQVVGPIITTYGTITNSNPWANFSF